jgi:hypothetical protein
MKPILILLLFTPLLSLGRVNQLRKTIKEALADKSGKQVCVVKVIPDKPTAIAVAEPILFKVYGKELILKEMPYDVHLVDSYWLITGSLPKSLRGTVTMGGTFLIILSSKDGQVIKLIYGK